MTNLHNLSSSFKATNFAYWIFKSLGEPSWTWHIQQKVDWETQSGDVTGDGWSLEPLHLGGSHQNGGFPQVFHWVFLPQKWIILGKNHHVRKQSFRKKNIAKTVYLASWNCGSIK